VSHHNDEKRKVFGPGVVVVEIPTACCTAQKLS
jgi:hypothetical protein